MENLLFLFISLVMILFSCILFSNAVEWLGVKLNLSHGVTGSILAAVGTALPETMVPLVAIFGCSSKESWIKAIKGEVDPTSSFDQISMGAIIGAPFMLITIAFCLVGFSAILYYKSGRRKSNLILVDKTLFVRDIKFFIISFSLAFLATFTIHIVKVFLALTLIIFYFVYIIKTLKEESSPANFESQELEESLEPLIFSKITPAFKPGVWLISAQLLISLIALIFSAHHFVDAIKEISHSLGFPPFIVSLLLAPLATELPEKFNSWMWIRGNKDTLAVGNISGALVFQSTFPVSIGLLFTSWAITSKISYFLFFACIINAFFLLYAVSKNKLNYKTFLWCGLFYFLYLILVVTLM